MAYSDGELIIPLSGRYYVYSQLYFQEAKKVHLIHFVHRSRNGTNTIIMRSVASRCHGQRASKGDNVKAFLYSSYQGGVFDLLADDRILVGVSEDNKGSISTGESASYFGAFLVWNDLNENKIIYCTNRPNKCIGSSVIEKKLGFSSTQAVRLQSKTTYCHALAREQYANVVAFQLPECSHWRNWWNHLAQASLSNLIYTVT